MIWGVSPVEVVGGQILTPPYEHPELGAITFWSNPGLWGCESFYTPQKLITALEFNPHCYEARVIDNLYVRESWANSSFDYHEICLDSFPDLPVLQSKRRNDYRRLRAEAEEWPQRTRYMHREEVLAALPLFRYDDSAALQIIPQYLNMPEIGIAALGYYEDERDGPRLNGISFVLARPAGDDLVLFNLGLVRVSQTLSAGVLTYWLAHHAREMGCRYLDVVNLALTPRETYKRMFFTGQRQGYCWSRGMTSKYPWIHRLEEDHGAL